MTKPRVGVIGVGHLGKEHARLYHKLGALAAVVDADGARAAEIAGKYGVSHYTDFRQLFGKVDAVSIAVPTVGHHEVAKEFLSRGVPALVE
ncbi:MAG: Gfo/Idh/MocA family oxidoreductase, partial [Chloroflexi bacterium]|nr:Gfo/Idh/MocA family oxidoreductase [Chloroflexota bacterium]